MRSEGRRRSSSFDCCRAVSWEADSTLEDGSCQLLSGTHLLRWFDEGLHREGQPPERIPMAPLDCISLWERRDVHLIGQHLPNQPAGAGLLLNLRGAYKHE